MAAEIKIPRAPAVKTRLSGFVHGTKHEARGVGLQCRESPRRCCPGHNDRARAPAVYGVIRPPVRMVGGEGYVVLRMPGWRETYILVWVPLSVTTTGYAIGGVRHRLDKLAEEYRTHAGYWRRHRRGLLSGARLLILQRRS